MSTYTRSRLMATALGAIGLIATVATPAAAAGNFSTGDGYTGEADGYVACDQDNGIMTVTAAAQTMTLQGMYGPTVGQFDNGQWMRYRVLVREVGATDWTVAADWSVWEWVVSRRSLGDGAWIDQPQTLGSTPVPVQRGNRWEALPQIDFWTGSDYVVNITPPQYSETLTMNQFSTYLLGTNFCTM